MAAINTQRLSDANDKVLSGVTSGLEKAKKRLLEVDKLPDEKVTKTFGALEKGLTKQHDFVEGLLAKSRKEETTTESA